MKVESLASTFNWSGAGSHRNPHTPPAACLHWLGFKWERRPDWNSQSHPEATPSKSCQINALHPSSVHMALKARSATQITALLNYNFVGSGSPLYPRHLEISLTDRAVSPDVSITCRGKWNRQLISRGLSQPDLSALGFGQKFITNKSVRHRPLACLDNVEWS